MAELATLARPYAEAMFEVAQKGDLKQASAELEALADVAENSQLREFADTPNQLLSRPKGVRAEWRPECAASSELSGDQFGCFAPCLQFGVRMCHLNQRPAGHQHR